jgi:hypothetical protein
MIKFFFLFLTLFISNAYALNLTGYHFSDSYRYAIVDDSMAEKFPGHFVLTTSIAYVDTPFYETDVVNNKVSRKIIEYHQLMTVGGTYYLSNESALTFKSAYLENKINNQVFHHLTDSEIKGRFNFYKEGAHSLSLNPVLTLPTGKVENFTTADSIGGGVSLTGEMAIDKVMLLGSMGYLTASKNMSSGIDYRELMTTSMALSWNFAENWFSNIETYRNFTLATDQGQDAGEYYLTFKNDSFKGVDIVGGAGIAGVYAPDNAHKTYFLGFKFFEK